MGTEKEAISDITVTSTTPPFAYDDQWNKFSSTPKLFPLSLSHPASLDSDDSFSRGWLAPETLTVLPGSSSQSYRDSHFRQDKNLTVSIARTLGQDTRGPSVLLDTRQWSPFQSSACATAGIHVPLMAMGSHAPLLSFPGSFAPDGALSPRIIPGPRQAIPDLNSGFSSSRYHHPNLGTDLNHPTFPKNNMPVSSSSSGSTEDRPSFLSDETQPPGVLYRTPEKKGLGRRRSQRVCALNIEGMWIDKDDLYYIAGQGGSMSSIHECQWAKSNDPCGMWIIGSRARIGAHVHKCHRRSHAADSRAQCLWDGCTAKAMLKDSISRHVMTVHLREGFRCQGCDQRFSRKDVYDLHVQKGEACRDAGAVMVYDTECRVIDTRKALEQGGAVRYTN